MYVYVDACMYVGVVMQQSGCNTHQRLRLSLSLRPGWLAGCLSAVSAVFAEGLRDSRVPGWSLQAFATRSMAPRGLF